VSTGGFDDNGGCEGLVVDFKGRPVDKSRVGGWFGAGLILVTELAERVCVMGISMNLVTYLTGDMHLSSAKSANIVTNFMGTLNLLALLGGFIADAKFGRYRTIAVSATITAVGVSLLAASTAVPGMRPPRCAAAAGGEARSRAAGCVPASGGQLGMLYAALYTIAAGGGGLKANVSGFGTDQFDGRDPREERAMLYFFNRFYFCISLGSLFAVTVLVYVQDNLGRAWGYGVAAAAMAAAVAVFAAGAPRYRYHRPQGSPLAVIGRVLWGAWRNRRMPCPADASELHGFREAKVPHTDRLRGFDRSFSLYEQVSGQSGHRGGRSGDGGDGDGGGGGEDGGEASPHVVHVHTLLDHLLPDDHLLHPAGRADGPPGRRPLRRPGGLALRLPLPLRPALHRAQRAPPGPSGGPPDAAPAGPDLPPACGRGARPRHARHGRLRARREETQGRLGRQRRRRRERALAGAAVLPGGRRRGVRVRGAAGVLHPGGPRADEVHEHGPVPGDAGHGVLPEQPSRARRRRRHAGRVDTWPPGRREAGPLLLDARGARTGQLRGVLGVR
uniref:Uncharacterized protein n=1 Tax=Aegilops tauschii subsp. strangulata TaxID=200361 RepID=A0A453C5Q9_AEGTS